MVDALGAGAVLLAAGAAAAGAEVVLLGAGFAFTPMGAVVLGAGVTAAWGAAVRHSMALFLLSHSTLAPTFQPVPALT